MEPAGRYMKENFKAFIKPKLRKCKLAIYELVKSIWLLLAATCFALAFAIAKMRSKENEGWKTKKDF